MPKVTASSGISDIVTSFSNAMDDFYETATILTHSSTLITYQTATGTVSLSGTDFVVETDLGGSFLTDGALETVVFTTAAGETITWSQIGLTVDELGVAFQAEFEQNPPQVDAIESLLLPLGWEFIGANEADIMTAQTRNADGVKLHYTGDDTFRMQGGADAVFASDGKDTVYGGNGNDTLDGGRGNDRLYGDNGSDVMDGGKGRDLIRGGKGHDEINGGAGRDNLIGGAHNDTLNGGADDDKINGGTGNNVMTGGTGSDQFRFTGSGTAQSDRITDFETGTDTIVIDAIATESLTLLDDGVGNVVVLYDSHYLMLENTDYAAVQGEIGNTIFIL